MSDEASSVFNSQATSYDGPRRFLIPPFEQFYAAAVEALGISGIEPERILDVSTSTGMMTAWARGKTYPEAHFTLLDGAGAMLKKARERLGTDQINTSKPTSAIRFPKGPGTQSSRRSPSTTTSTKASRASSAGSMTG